MVEFDGEMREGVYVEEEHKKLREEYLSKLFDLYESKVLSSTVFSFKETAHAVNLMYWRILQDFVKKYFKNDGADSLVDRHKIISIMEVVVMGMLPLTSSERVSQEELRKQNASFAQWLALSIYGAFYKNVYSSKPTNIELSKFIGSHMKWLTTLQFSLSKKHSPQAALSIIIFSNAATWYGIDQYILAKNDKL